MSTKRREIIKISSLLMSDKGYIDTSLNDILEQAGIGKGQFYHYFSSKHDLGSAVIDDCFDFFNKKLLEEVLDSPKDPESRLEDMLDWIVAFHRRRTPGRGCFFGNMALELSAHDELFRVRLKNVFESWAGKIEKLLHEMAASADAGQRADVSRRDPDEVKKFSRNIVAMLEGGFLLMKNYQDLEILEEMTGTILFLVNAYKRKNDITGEKHGTPHSN
ncbi:MAG: TetR/AcrR family transcriptional regulator [Desulfovibrio sp.]|nr:TetR/AcrR family transcriptional regulator [Desulfovibrio sp.]